VTEKGHLPARAVVGVDRPDVEPGIVEMLAVRLEVGEAGLLADIECGVGVEDVEAALQQEEQADHPDPVGDPRPDRLPVDQRPFGPGRLVDAGRLRNARHDAPLSLPWMVEETARSPGKFQVTFSRFPGE
jgi:hypothetical protein